jgi:DNA-directed RNA polymerase alpha subunit
MFHEGAEKAIEPWSLVERTDLSGFDLSGLNLTGVDFQNVTSKNVKFCGSNLVGAVFHNADLSGSDFSAANLRGAKFIDSDLTAVDFIGANLEETSFENAEGLSEIDAYKSNLATTIPGVTEDFSAAGWGVKILNEPHLKKILSLTNSGEFERALVYSLNLNPALLRNFDTELIAEIMDPEEFKVKIQAVIDDVGTPNSEPVYNEEKTILEDQILEEVDGLGQIPEYVEELGLQVRTENALLRAGLFRTAEAIKGIEETGLLDLRNFGETSLNDLNSRLRFFSEKNWSASGNEASSFLEGSRTSNGVASLVAYSGSSLVADLGFNRRVLTCFRRAQIVSIQQLLELSDTELLQLPSFGAGSLKEVRLKVDEIRSLKTTSVNGTKQFHSSLVADFGFSRRVLTCFRRARIVSIQQLLELSDAELLQLPSFGAGSLKEVRLKVDEIRSLKTTSVNGTKHFHIESRNLVGRSDDGLHEGLPEFMVDLGLTERTTNCLKAAGLLRTEQVLAENDKTLLTLPNFGETSLRDLKKRLFELPQVAEIASLQTKRVNDSNIREAASSYLKAGTGFRAISERFGVPPEAFLPLYIEHQSTRKLIDGLYDKGFSFAKVAKITELNYEQLGQFWFTIPSVQERRNEAFFQKDPLWKIADSLQVPRSVMDQMRKAFIRDLRIQGKSFRAIGEIFGVTAEAMRRQCKRIGVPTASEIKAEKNKNKNKKMQNLRASLLENLKHSPGVTLAVLAERVGMDEESVGSALLPEHNRYLIQENNVEDDADQKWMPVWPAERIKAVLQTAATYHFPLTTLNYSNLVSVGEIDGPTVATIHKRFGSWVNACEEAGVECGTSNIVNYQSLWTDDDLVEWVLKFLLAEGPRWSFNEMANWLASFADAPSCPTLRNRLGGWEAMKTLAWGRYNSR